MRSEAAQQRAAAVSGDDAGRGGSHGLELIPIETNAPGSTAPSELGASTSSAPVPRTAAASRPARAGTSPATPSFHPGTEAESPCPDVAPGTGGITDEALLVGAPRVEFDDPTFEAPDARVQDYVDAMVDDINARGGLACRRVEIVWHDISLSAWARGDATIQQAQCATWTQDHRVFAAVPFTEAGDVLYPCLDRAGVVTVDVKGYSHNDAHTLRGLPHLFQPNAEEMGRSTVALVEALVRQRFLTSSSRIGVVHYDDPQSTRTVDEALLPTLARYGMEPAERRAIAIPEGASGMAERDQQIANAALRFKVSEVDRVLFVRGDGLAGGFMTAAEANAYRPRYGLTTAELPVVLFDPPPAQLVGARGIGWLPHSDIQPRWPEPWTEQAACRRFYEERGFDLSGLIDRAVALQVCEAVWFIAAGVASAPEPLSAASFIAGVESFGDGYGSPTVGRTAFGPAQHDGVATYRDVAFREDCGCFEYEGPARRMGR